MVEEAMGATARIALFTLSVGLVGCVTQPEMGWIRTDGKAVVPIQLEADQKQCDGESDKADLSSTMKPGISICPGVGPCSPRQEALKSVFNGCMAGKGYVQRPMSRV
jgi:hypothetical protein